MTARRGPLFAGFPAPLIVGMWTVFGTAKAYEERWLREDRRHTRRWRAERRGRGRGDEIS